MRKKVFWAVVKYTMFLFVSLFVILTVGCSTDDNPVLQTQRGSISGLVLDSNNKAVKGAIVTSNRSLYKAETDEMGRYMFTSLDTGHHYLTAERDGYFLGSSTVELGYGQTLYGINIMVEGMEKMISSSVAVREKTSAVLDIKCYEKMSVSVSYREMSRMPSVTEPTSEMNTQHRITLNNLYPGAEYYYTVTGKTADGRSFTTENMSFKTVNLYDVDGAPDSPENFKITQTFDGPKLSWEYNGKDPIQGFRIYRSENGGKMVLLREENDVFSSQTSIVDDCVFAGRYYTYDVYAVDYEGNLSEIPAKKSFIPTGSVSENIVWKKEWSPIDIEGDIRIPPLYTLTIEPGTSIRFLAESDISTGFKKSLCEFVVEGTLIACGTEDEPIKFLSQSSIPLKDDWDGIRFLSSDEKNKSEINHVIISGADTGLEIYGNNIKVNNYKARYCKTGLALLTASGTTLTGFSVEDCETGLKAEGTTNCLIADFDAVNCDTAVVLNNNISLRLNNFDVRNCYTAGLRSSDKIDTIIRNAVIHSLKNGLTISGDKCNVQFVTIDAENGILLEGASDAVIMNNIIVNMTSNGSGNGIEDMSASGKAYTYNNIYGFRNATVNCTQLGASVYNIDPMFMGLQGSKYDYHLSSISGLLNVASNRGQIGAYGCE